MQRELPSAIVGGPPNGDARLRRFARLAAYAGAPDRRPIRLLTAGVAVLALGLTAAVPAAADELDDQRDRVSQQLTAAQAQLDSDTKQLANASSALQQSQAQLKAARDELAATQWRLAQAQRQDRQAAARWTQAQRDLEAAKAAVAEGERNVAAQLHEVGNVARTQYQQQRGMVGIGMVVTGSNTGDINNRIQWSTTVFDSTQSELDKLQDLQRQLVAAQERQAQIEQEMAAARRVAAENLVTRTRLSAAAAEQERSVASLVAGNVAVEASVSQQRDASQAQAEALSSEQSTVEARIIERNARVEAEKTRRAEQERVAREQAADAASRAAADSARSDTESVDTTDEAASSTDEAASSTAESSTAESSAGTQPEPSAPSTSAEPTASAEPETKPEPEAKPEPEPEAKPEPAPAPVAKKKEPAPISRGASEPRAAAPSGPFATPSSGGVTSRYGMRFHPVLKVWKLHDGTDYGAACDAPIRAAADGRVAERYYNAGYGNRLMIDHGRINGRYTTTGYNHATHYVVRPGQWVRKGQVIGYVGSTGYSTGCHLHLMTWSNGKVTNPQSLGF